MIHFFKNILNTLNSPSPSRDDTFISDSSPESIINHCKTSKRAQVKNSKKAQPNKGKDCKNTIDEVCKENFHRPIQQRNVAGKSLLLRTHNYNNVQESCIGLPNEYNIIQHLGNKKMLRRTIFIW